MTSVQRSKQLVNFTKSCLFSSTTSSTTALVQKLAKENDDAAAVVRKATLMATRDVGHSTSHAIPSLIRRPHSTGDSSSSLNKGTRYSRSDFLVSVRKVVVRTYINSFLKKVDKVMIVVRDLTNLSKTTFWWRSIV